MGRCVCSGLRKSNFKRCVTSADRCVSVRSTSSIAERLPEARTSAGQQCAIQTRRTRSHP
eukprot:3529680-Prymnesium_polylepis.1